MVLVVEFEVTPDDVEKIRYFLLHPRQMGSSPVGPMEVLEIRHRLQDPDVTYAEVAADYPLGAHGVSKIARHVSWPGLGPKVPQRRDGPDRTRQTRLEVVG